MGERIKRVDGTEFEREYFISVVAMSAQGAREFICPTAFRVTCVGQADPTRYRFGARRYRVFVTANDWSKYCAETRKAVG